MYKQILLAYDGSQAGQKALLDCQDIVQWSGAALTLVAVMPKEIVFGVAEGASTTQRSMRAKKRVIKMCSIRACEPWPTLALRCQARCWWAIRCMKFAALREKFQSI